MLKEFKGHYRKFLKYGCLEVDLLRGAVIAKTGIDDLFSENMQPILQGAGVCPRSTKSSWNRGKVSYQYRLKV